MAERTTRGRSARAPRAIFSRVVKSLESRKAQLSGMPASLRHLKAIVTGATSGIGAATARHFAKHGATLLATGRNKDALDKLKQETNCHILDADLTLPRACEKVVVEAVKAMDGLTTLVNCAGVLQPGAMGDATLENFNFNFAGNVQNQFEMIVHSIPHLKAAGVDAGPSIVNVSSVNGLVSFGGVATYCAAKAALDMLARCAAVDLAPYGIRVNNVNPGLVLTELQRRGGLTEEQYQMLVQRSMEVTHPLAKSLGRCASAEEVAQLIAFLASSDAAFITGDCIKIDGGRGCVGAR